MPLAGRPPHTSGHEHLPHVPVPADADRLRSTESFAVGLRSGLGSDREPPARPTEHRRAGHLHNRLRLLLPPPPRPLSHPWERRPHNRPRALHRSLRRRLRRLPPPVGPGRPSGSGPYVAGRPYSHRGRTRHLGDRARRRPGVLSPAQPRRLVRSNPAE